MSVDVYKNIEDLPLALSVEQVAAAIGVSRKTAYNIVKEEGLAIRVGSKRLICPKDRLVAYLNRKENLFDENEKGK